MLAEVEKLDAAVRFLKKGSITYDIGHNIDRGR